MILDITVNFKKQYYQVFFTKKDQMEITWLLVTAKPERTEKLLMLRNMVNL